MINFTNLLAINDRGYNSKTYINPEQIVKIENEKGNNAKVTYTTGKTDTFELSASQLAKEIAESQDSFVKEVSDEKNTPFTF